jgi:hypothetical protein
MCSNCHTTTTIAQIGRLLLVLCFLIASVHAEDKPKFRTDADGPVKADEKKKNPKDKKPDDKPEWYQLVEGQFPPVAKRLAASTARTLTSIKQIVA